MYHLAIHIVPSNYHLQNTSLSPTARLLQLPDNIQLWLLPDI
ncbi:hypothetical protein A1OE_449 [Candidatus Endolissoclinum faulkneri L2]|uniref:Uncharacterized protein n=1 Tax=Candidatus Endolissoclinum faulkneri L2 TaxID=1193729 RepID=K7YMA7_9PROT|nr:hypothetical protein A1OE_449 [Candidatus Endolissoclinum faulkneri L2]